MPPSAIRVEHLTKEYVLGEATSSVALRDSINRAILAPHRLLRAVTSRRGSRTPRADRFRAVDDLSFEIQQGEAVAIIGRNGAGKSTLLKMLSRIVYPTAGRAVLHGRVGSLLEVGTGFHPELSGRENVYFNGALLGMRRREIDARFDAIVDFAGIERFLDTPIKRYSSGMSVRLAFAVAAHLEPEILIVDEVLAVGDARFQRKCLDKMQDVGKSGRTVLFVSHNMSAVTRLCPRAIALDAGRLVADGISSSVVTSYLRSDLGTMAAREWTGFDAPGDATARLRAVRVRDPAGHVTDAIDVRSAVDVEIEYDVLKEASLLTHLHVLNEEGIHVFVAIENAAHEGPRRVGRHRTIVGIPGNFLSEGTLVLGVALGNHDTLTAHYFEQDAVAFRVVDRDEGPSSRGTFPGSLPGVVRPLLRWTSTSVDVSLHGTLDGERGVGG